MIIVNYLRKINNDTMIYFAINSNNLCHNIFFGKFNKIITI